MAIKYNTLQRLRKSLHLTSQTPFNKFLPGSYYPALLTLKRQADLLEIWGFTFCLTLLQRIMLVLLTAAPACSRLLPCQVDSLCKPPGTTVWVAKQAVAGKGGRGNSAQGRRWLWWPEECSPSMGCHGRRASPSALGAKGERCKAWPWTALVQGFGLAVGQ